jgi:excisionase family DNA binding protein
MSDEPLLTPLDVSKRLRISRAGAYRLLQRGGEIGLPVVRIGKNVRLRQEDLREFIARGGCAGVPAAKRKGEAAVSEMTENA